MSFAKENRKPNLYLLWSVLALVILILAGLVSYFFVSSHLNSQSRLVNLQNAIEEQINQRLQVEVQDAARFAELEYQQAEQVLMDESRDQVQQALAVMQGIYDQHHEAMPDAELRQLLLESLRNVRFFNGRGYIFIGNSKGDSLLLPPAPDLEGSSMYDLKDDQGNYFVRRFLEIINSDQGYGYARYRWYPPGNREVMKDKITYIGHFEPYHWLVGAGDYVYQIQQDLQKDIIRHIENIQFGKDGYISIIDRNGFLVGGQGIDQFTAMHYSQLYAPEDRNRVSHLLKSIKEEGFYRADWYFKDSSRSVDQLLYIKPLPVWDWILVAGTYNDPSLAMLDHERESLAQQSGEDNGQLIITLLVILAVALLTIRHYSRWIRQTFSHYQKDIENQNQILKENARSLEVSARIVEAAHEGIMLTDAKNKIIRVNDSFTRITGFERDEMIGLDPAVLSSGHHNQQFYRDMWHSIEKLGEWQGEIWNRRKNGTLYPQALSVTCYRNQNGEIENYIGTFSDISQRKAIEEELEHMAQSDSLTDLPNRRLLGERLEHELAVISRYPSRQQLALIYLDLDRFKEINDTYGHGVGDQVLICVARRLNDLVRSTDLVCRIGGDEFVVLIVHEDIEVAAAHLAERVIKLIAEPVLVAGEQLSMTTSLGIALGPQDSQDKEELLEFADMALYEAKQKGRNNFQFFELWMCEARAERLKNADKPGSVTRNGVSETEPV